jgi:hypothetical protein
VRILLWHVHGSWTTSLVQGHHDYVVPLTSGRDADGRGRARTWDWPSSVLEVPVDRLVDVGFDVVLLQRPHELDLAESWTGRRPGRDVPAVYVEHNTPAGAVPFTRHPLADQTAIPVVHVTHFNRLIWDTGVAPTAVVEHGIVDPGHRYTGELARAAVVVNEPLRRGRAVGTDLLAGLAEAVPLDVFGMGVDALADRLGADPERLRTFEDLPQDKMHDELARRRVYLHLHRWTSLGLSLLEAMTIGMPVVGLAMTEVAVAVPPDAGFLATDPELLGARVRELVEHPEEARRIGDRAREAALRHHGLDRFLTDWDEVLDRAARRRV